MGHHKEPLRQKDRSLLILAVGVMTLVPKDEAEGIKYALIQLEGGWESLESDRTLWPSDFNQ